MILISSFSLPPWLIPSKSELIESAMSMCEACNEVATVRIQQDNGLKRRFCHEHGLEALQEEVQ